MMEEGGMPNTELFLKSPMQFYHLLNTRLNYDGWDSKILQMGLGHGQMRVNIYIYIYN